MRIIDNDIDLDRARDEFRFGFILLKVAARCNLNCTYCYWFRDKDVLRRPKLMSEEVMRAFHHRLESYLRYYTPKRFSINFHGGEPLLFPKARFIDSCRKIREIEARTGVPLRISLVTNGTLLDDEWLRILRIFNVALTLSVDGPREVHDRARVYRNGRGSHEAVIRALRMVQDAGLNYGVLAVADPSRTPEEITEYFINDLHLDSFDLLVPDFNHEDRERIVSIAPYYTRLLRLWLDEYLPRGIEIRFASNVVNAILGGESSVESIGYGPIGTLTLLTDGMLEPLDVLRIGGDGITRSTSNVLTHEFMDVREDPTWREAFEASLRLPRECLECKFRVPCGGGYLPSRYSKENRYNNPSVYCDDLKKIFQHANNLLRERVAIRHRETSHPLQHREMIEVVNTISAQAEPRCR